MDNKYLEELIAEVHGRGGGIILNMHERPQAVVLSIERYNELVETQKLEKSKEKIVSESNIEEIMPHQNKKTILVTGGAGYIGAHVVRRLLKQGHEVVVLDNLVTGRRENVATEAKFIDGDLADTNLLRDIFASQHFDCVVHMAASLEIEESVRFPGKYLENNVINTQKLLGVMCEAEVKDIIFSSTAAIYGEQQHMPIPEQAHLQPNNPYGYSKFLAEKIIKYYCRFAGMRAVVFRYFNACGSDFDGMIVDTHKNAHLIPIVLEVAKGNKPFLTVNGRDYDTSDGSCVRDYMHVLDIAEAHSVAIEKMQEAEGFTVYNLGTGKGASVCEVIQKASEVLEKIIPMENGGRRAGDVAITVADNSKIRKDWSFEPKFSDMETIIKTSWNMR